jgi:hypothetical protein
MRAEILVSDIVALGFAAAVRNAGIDPAQSYRRYDIHHPRAGTVIVEGEPLKMDDPTGSLFAGEPDARQTDEAVMAPQHGLFRKRYRKLSATDIETQDAIKDIASVLAEAIGRLNVDVAKKLGVTFEDEEMERALGYACDPAGVTLAIRHLEDAVYRAVKVLTA